jgi:hypothetical protein
VDQVPDRRSSGNALTRGARAVGGFILAEAKMWLQWTLGGAIVGAIGLGGTGFYLGGLTGLMWGAGAGVVVGGLVGLVIILLASSDSIFS